LSSVTAVLFVLIALVSGSRAGLILCTGGLIASALLFGGSIRALSVRTRWTIIGGSLGALLIVLLLATAFGRALVLDRLDTTGISSDQRFRAFPVLIELIRTYFPFGSGMGTFDPVFRMLEPDADLDRGFFNNAHNDLIELIITGGLPALALLAGFAAWLVAQLVAAIRSRGAIDAATVRGWIGLVVIALLLAASLFDYPLRTPLLSMIFTLACCWASAFGDTRHTGGRGIASAGPV
jgi:O-antigen ligase